MSVQATGHSRVYPPSCPFGGMGRTYWSLVVTVALLWRLMVLGTLSLLLKTMILYYIVCPRKWSDVQIFDRLNYF